MASTSKRPWDLAERHVTPEQVYRSRRAFIRQLALGGIGALGLGCEENALPLHSVPLGERNERFLSGRPLTPESIASRYNNFYEFSTDKEDVADVAAGFRTRPWTIEVVGEVARPRTYDIDALLQRMPTDERVYRLRCVEAWAMVVPWSGFPLRALLQEAQPTSDARYVRFVSAVDEAQMPGVRAADWYPWPYHEGLRLDEAMNELTFIATGVYGHPLPPQHGAPLRLVVPWKYGFKSAKSLVRIELVRAEPPTFWHRMFPQEYGFTANVDPEVPHPRWSQATERMIDSGAEVPTRLFNGYGEWVSGLY